MSIINDAQTNHVCVLSVITLSSYFCLNTAQYIVENSECFITDACVCWRSL